MIYTQIGLQTNRLIPENSAKNNRPKDDFEYLSKSKTQLVRDDQIEDFKLKNGKYFISGFMKSPIRSNRNLKYRTVLPLDFDREENEEKLLNSIEYRFKRTLFLRYPSISYGYKKGARYRLILAVNRPFTEDEYSKLYELFSTKLPLDINAKQWSQVFGLPVVNKYSSQLKNCGYLKHDGLPLDIDGCLAQYNSIFKVTRQTNYVGDPNPKTMSHNYTAKVVNETLAPIKDGARHTQLVKYCGKLFRTQISGEMIFTLLNIKNDKCKPPLTQSEIDAIFTNIAQKEIGRRNRSGG